MSRVQTSKTRWSKAAVAATAVASSLFGLTPAVEAHAEANLAISTTSYPTIQVNGHGWGHGRGLSQYGAYGYAEQGWSSDAILNHYYGGTTGGPVPAGATNPDPANLRVELRSNRGFETRVDVEVGSIRVLDGATELLVTTPDSGAAVRIGSSGSGLVVETSGSCSGPWTAVATVPSAMLTIERTATGSDADDLLRVCEPTGSSTWYEGTMQSYNHNGSTRTINVVSVEQYLRGVVPREMPAGWPTAALEAQAVSARSYALAGDTRQQPYADTCDTTLCQVYRGRYAQAGEFTISTHERTDAAIANTVGQVRLFGTSIARTEFSSSTGGWSTGGTFPAVEDAGDAIAANPNHDWSVAVNLRAFEESQNVPNDGNADLGHLIRVEVTERNGLGEDGGRATLVVFTFTSGSITKTGNQARVLMGLKSDWFTTMSVERVFTDTAAAYYIDHVFNLFLMRDPTDVERAAWVSHVELGQRDDLTAALSISSEWAGMSIDEFYQNALGRPADAHGRAHWLGQVSTGVRMEKVGAHFYGSPEYFERSGGTNESFVAALYRDLLGREAEASGLASWSAQLESGAMTSGDVAAGFYASIESRTARVEGLYQQVLGRQPETSGLAFWADRLLETDDVRLASELAASTESFAIAQS